MFLATLSMTVMALLPLGHNYDAARYTIHDAARYTMTMLLGVLFDAARYTITIVKLL